MLLLCSVTQIRVLPHLLYKEYLRLFLQFGLNICGGWGGVFYLVEDLGGVFFPIFYFYG